VVIGVHSPEFGFEKKRAGLEAEVEQHGLRYPQYIDNDHAYWRALDAQFWPSTYLIDKCGRIRVTHIGEIHAGEKSGNDVEAAIEALLNESPDCTRS
jgi:hypothetical protein